MVVGGLGFRDVESINGIDGVGDGVRDVLSGAWF
jgi:hypothetical protein